MTWSVLVVTPHLAFGELLRLSLEESGEYQVSQVESGLQALAGMERNKYALAILDSDLADQPFTVLAQTLHALSPDLRVIVIPPENNQAQPSPADIKPDACLNRRFYVPDLLHTVKKVLSPGEPMSEQTPAPDAPAILPAPPRYPWQVDPDQAALQLTGGLVGSSAQAALMVRNKQIWASAGSIDQAAVKEISAILGRYLDGAEKGDLARFMRLNSNKSEYIVYATPLVDNLALALVFDAATPLTRIRTQVIRLAHSLKHTDTSPEQAAFAPIIPVSPIPANQDTGKGENAQISLAELLAYMPSPEPDAEGFAVDDWMPASQDAKSSAMDPAGAAPAPTPESLPPYPLAPGVNLNPNKGPSNAGSLPLAGQPFNRLNDLEGVSPCYSRLIYTCLMIPRMPQHSLTGELAKHLTQWFSQCCLAFGWRLESLLVRPEYVQWMVEASPEITPGNMVHILRQRISQAIFNQYPHLVSENPSGDFWAPGYLIVSGQVPPDSLMAGEFVEESRRRQGLFR